MDGISAFRKTHVAVKSLTPIVAILSSVLSALPWAVHPPPIVRAHCITAQYVRVEGGTSQDISTGGW